jgi:D-alanyl-D-alanine endopeptidase (penicillin-binding protein 7)
MVMSIVHLPAMAQITASAYIVVDLDGNVLLQKDADVDHSIASITKLIIADQSHGLDPNEKITISRNDIKSGKMKSTPLKQGQTYTRSQLTELALVSSDNVAAIALGHSVPFGLNSYATLVEASGLNAQNRSTARSLAMLAKDLYNSEVAKISTRQVTEVGNRRSTNPLLSKAGWVFYLSKTGFINASGGCLVVITEIKSQIAIVVILGAKDTKHRWLDLAQIRRQLGDEGFYVPFKVTEVAKFKKINPKGRPRASK